MSGHDREPVPGRQFRVELVDGNGRATELGCCEVVFPPLAAHAEAQAAVAEEHLVLRRATGGDELLHAWWSRACRGRAPQRRSVRVTLLAPDRERVVMCWRFRNARPASLHYSPLNANESALVFESLAVAFDGVEIDSKPD